MPTALPEHADVVVSTCSPDPKRTPDMETIDPGLLILRLALGVVLLAHGRNHP
jgi:hypothetical protein